MVVSLDWNQCECRDSKEYLWDLGCDIFEMCCRHRCIGSWEQTSCHLNSFSMRLWMWLGSWRGPWLFCCCSKRLLSHRRTNAQIVCRDNYAVKKEEQCTVSLSLSFLFSLLTFIIKKLCPIKQNWSQIILDLLPPLATTCVLYLFKYHILLRVLITCIWISFESAFRVVSEC